MAAVLSKGGVVYGPGGGDSVAIRKFSNEQFITAADLRAMGLVVEARMLEGRPVPRNSPAYEAAKARAEADWQDGQPFPVVVAVAEVCGLGVRDLDMHVEGLHGWEPHDSGYEDAVWVAAQCRADSCLRELRKRG
jgi:hypothetical protein